MIQLVIGINLAKTVLWQILMAEEAKEMNWLCDEKWTLMKFVLQHSFFFQEKSFHHWDRASKRVLCGSTILLTLGHFVK